MAGVAQDTAATAPVAKPKLQAAMGAIRQGHVQHTRENTMAVAGALSGAIAKQFPNKA
jgi:hypothetical protein